MKSKAFWIKASAFVLGVAVVIGVLIYKQQRRTPEKIHRFWTLEKGIYEMSEDGEPLETETSTATATQTPVMTPPPSQPDIMISPVGSRAPEAVMGIMLKEMVEQRRYYGQILSTLDSLATEKRGLQEGLTEPNLPATRLFDAFLERGDYYRWERSEWRQDFPACNRVASILAAAEERLLEYFVGFCAGSVEQQTLRERLDRTLERFDETAENPGGAVPQTLAEGSDRQTEPLSDQALSLITEQIVETYGKVDFSLFRLKSFTEDAASSNEEIHQQRLKAQLEKVKTDLERAACTSDLLTVFDRPVAEPMEALTALLATIGGDIYLHASRKETEELKEQIKKFQTIHEKLVELIEESR